jgi:hypothetical protein
MIKTQVFREIIKRLITPKNDQLVEEWRKATYALDTSELATIKNQIAVIDKYLQQEPKKVLVAYPYISLYLAHCYNLGFYAGKKLYLRPAIANAQSALTGFQANLNIYDDPLNDFNLALSHWYLGLLNYNNQAFRTCLTHLDKSNRIFSELQDTCRHEGLFEKCEEIKWMRYVLRKWIKFAIRKNQ